MLVVLLVVVLGNSATATKLLNATSKQTITKEDTDVKMIVVARKYANVVSLHFTMTYKTTDILMQFTDAIPTAYRPKENIRMTGINSSQIIVGTTGAVTGNYVENLGTNFVITYIVD